MLKKLKRIIALDNPFRLLYHKIRAIIASIVYWFPSKNMHVIWVTWTNWNTTTCNLIAKWLQKVWKKVFMFTTVNIIIWEEEYTNNSKMTSPDSFYLQKLLKLAKSKWCDTAIIETASHGIKMHRIWGINYDIAVLTNISQDHLDLHRTMEDYVETKLKLFKHLIWSRRKNWIKKIWIINSESEYNESFTAETYDYMLTYWVTRNANLVAQNIKTQLSWTSFDLKIPWNTLKLKTPLIWKFNVYNSLAAIWVFVSIWIKEDDIEKIINDSKAIHGRMEEIKNEENIKIFIDYAYTPDAIENILETVKSIKWINRIITVFWATWDRDKTKRPIMWQIISENSDIVILTEDDNYAEDIKEIVKDVLPWIERKQWEDFWVILNREEAIRTALMYAKENDVVLILWKWDEHSMITNNWPIKWHDKSVVKKILKWIDDHKLIK